MRASLGASCSLTWIGSHLRLTDVLPATLSGAYKYCRARFPGRHGARHPLPAMPPLAVGVGLLVVPEKAKGEGRTPPPTSRRLLLSRLQAARESVYFRET